MSQPLLNYIQLYSTKTLNMQDLRILNRLEYRTLIFKESIGW